MAARITIETKMIGDRLAASVQLSNANAADLVCAADCLLRIVRDNVAGQAEAMVRYMIDGMPAQLTASAACPICGVDTPHHHTAAEIAAGKQ